MKKYFFAIVVSLSLLMAAAGAVDPSIFPVETIGMDGASRWGYLDESGEQKIGSFYSDTSTFNEYGLAVIKNAQNQYGVIDLTGRQIVPYQDGAQPETIDCENESLIALRYADKTVFYTHSGALYGTGFPATNAFFADDLLRVQQNGKWGYALRNGKLGIPARFLAAGDFSNGRALVQTSEDEYAVLLQNGTVQPLPSEPAYLSVFHNNTVVLRDGDAMRLYSAAERAYVGDMVYQEVSAFSPDGYAMAKQGNKWGILTSKGEFSVSPQFYSLSDMGEGMYAARAKNGEVLVMNGSGTRIYYTNVSSGGFPAFRYGISYHATADGGILFFNQNGVFTRKVANAENPEIVSRDVAAVTIAGKRQYIRLSDGKVLYAPQRTYQLEDGITVTTREYEKYVGTLSNNTEYGWNLSYPQFSGMQDTAVQTKINSSIEKFFLDGPSQAARKTSVVGDYGFVFHGRLLVVYADAEVGLGTKKTLWNDNIALDFSSGEVYSAFEDLLLPGYETALRAQIPDDIDYDDYQYPRMTDSSLLLYRNVTAPGSALPLSETLEIPYRSLAKYINMDSNCYRALLGTANTPSTLNTRFSDVARNHWAYSYIEQVAARNIMEGDGVRFYPESSLLASEAVAPLVRGLALPAGDMPGIDSGKWYKAEVGAAQDAGLLSDAQSLSWESEISRMDVMQLIANARRLRNSETLSDVQISEVLSAFRDADQIPPSRREAIAYCVGQEIVQGSDGLLRPSAAITRAEFSKLLLAALPETTR